jgi:hypothetical protein
MFIARALASSFLGPKEWTPLKFPQLEAGSDAETLYYQAYGESTKSQDPYVNTWNSPIQKDEETEETEITRGPRVHEPYHDVESIFWVMAVFLLKVLPLNPRNTDTTAIQDRFNDTWKAFSQHAIAPTIGDSREKFFDDRRMYHPDIQPFGARLMNQLCLYIRPDYMRLEVKPSDFHLHECLRRVLLSFICEERGRSPVLFDTQNVRIPRSSGNPESFSSVSTPTSCLSAMKRKSSSSWLLSSPNRRGRPEKQSPSRSPLSETPLTDF